MYCKDFFYSTAKLPNTRIEVDNKLQRREMDTALLSSHNNYINKIV
jgi:hypothetical protein